MKKTQEILSWIESRQEYMLSELQKWANINSHTFNMEGLARMQDVLTKAFSVLDGKLSVLESKKLETVNRSGEIVQTSLGNIIHIEKRPEAKQQVVLAIHMDTVYPKDSAFQKCQINKDGHVNGPGVTDAKGGLMIMLHALEAFEQSQHADQLGWQVIINADEETGSHGSVHVFKEAAERAKWGLLFEPALPNGKLIHQRKGSGNFSVVVHGFAAHAGRDFKRGKNAIVALSDFFCNIYQLSYTRDELTVNPGQFFGGEGLNIVPPLAVGYFNVRVNQPEDQDYIKSEINKIISQIQEKYGVNITLHGDFFAPVKPLDDGAKKLVNMIESAYKELGEDIQWQASGGVCDGNRLAFYGVPTIDSLGADGDFIHNQNEYIVNSSLSRKAKAAYLMLEKIALGELDQ